MWMVVLIITIALIFDFLNGMNDAANSISTMVATRAPSPSSPVNSWSRDNLLTKDGS